MIKLNITEFGLQEFPFDDKKPFIEVTDEQYLKIRNCYLIFKDGQLIENPEFAQNNE